MAASALRYYERLGLLLPAGRSNARRYYGPEGTQRIALIRLFQDAGFTLPEIRALIAAGSRQHRSWRQLLAAKLRELETSIAHAARAKALIEHALGCRYRELSMCPKFLAALDDRFANTARGAMRVYVPTVSKARLER